MIGYRLSWLSGLCEHDLVRGETGIVLCIAPDQRQAKIVSFQAESNDERHVQASQAPLTSSPRLVDRK
jgi:hypothetical protein